MLPYLLLGATYAFAAVVQPGPFQTFLLSETLTAGWRRTLPAALSPLLSDGPIIVLVVIVLSRVPLPLQAGLRLAGGLFLLTLAGGALKAWKHPPGPAEPISFPGRSLLKGVAVNLLNPNPWLGWSLVLGPLLLKGWGEAPAHGLALLIGFYGTLVVGTAALIALAAGAGRLGPRQARKLIGVSAVALTAVGVWQIVSGAREILTW